MSLSDHARAARIIGEELLRIAQEHREPFAIGYCRGIIAAADRMEAEARDEARRTAAAHACTFDHATMPTPTCPACKAPRKPK